MKVNGYIVAAVSLMMILSGCSLLDTIFGRMAEADSVTVTLEPVKRASTAGQDELHRFDSYGTCDAGPFWPVANRSGTALLWMWVQAMSASSDSEPRYPAYNDFDLAGYELTHNRGESCHHRNMRGYQAAVKFDLSDLPPGAVTSAQLEVVYTKNLGVDPPYLEGTDTQCRMLMLGVATESWDAGWNWPATAVAWRVAARDRGPHLFPLSGRTSSGYSFSSYRAYVRTFNVSREVTNWMGSTANHGFVITPNTQQINEIYESIDADDEGNFQCPVWLLEYHLEVTILTNET